MSQAPATRGDTAVQPAPEPRVTRQRLAVSAAMDTIEDFVSAQELFRILQGKREPISLATVYRILQALAEEGRVDALRNDDGEAIYRRCAVTTHHHHLLCRSCGKVVEIQAPEVERWTEAVAADSGFVDVDHTVEISGLCPHCASGASANG